MHGLSVRWSLEQSPPGTGETLRRYVADTSMARFQGRAGLRFKTWRMREGEWFEGTYVFADERSRDEFAAEFAAVAATAPGSKIIGSEPELMEPFEVVAVAEGGDGFASGPGPGA